MLKCPCVVIVEGVDVRGDETALELSCNRDQYGADFGCVGRLADRR